MRNFMIQIQPPNCKSQMMPFSTAVPADGIPEPAMNWDSIRHAAVNSPRTSPFLAALFHNIFFESGLFIKLKVDSAKIEKILYLCSLVILKVEL